MNKLYPLKLQPALHVKVWGGRKLAQMLHKDLPTAEPYGEAWELHDSALVANGPLRGLALGALTKRFGADLIGVNNDPAEGFPLLAKFIDANAWLSIQVHPNDAQAQALENAPRGKTEAWIVLAAEAGAQLVIGLQPGSRRAQIQAAIRENRLEELLVYAAVQAGDVLYIPANTVHALGPGLLIYEIQQSSDITYRLYDWGRLGLDGQPRQLHIKKGSQVANLDSLPAVRQPASDLLVEGDFFCTWRHRLNGERRHLSTAGYFHCLTCISGSARIEVEPATGPALVLEKGQTGLVPACISDYTVSGAGTVLRSQQAPTH